MNLGVASGVKQLQERLADGLALPFLDIFKDCPLKSILEFPLRVFRKRIYTPGVTLLAFISQLLDSDHSCSRAVSRVINHYVGLSGRAPPSTDTGAYVKARQRLPERWMIEVLGWTNERIEQEIRKESLWLGLHRVLSADGSSAQTPDTPKNRDAFGLPGSVKPGCGLPVVYFAALFCLASGLLVDLSFQPKGGSERHLFRKLWGTLRRGDVAMGDRGTCSYADVALLLPRGVHCVFRIFNRKVDYRKGRSLGKYDHIVEWHKPKSSPRGMTEEEFAGLPDVITVREVRVNVTIKGFRSRRIDIVTTLLDAKLYSKEALADLYRRRWDVEINLRHVKTTLGMELLTTKSPDMIRKEVLAYMIAYNLTRTLMWEAAKEHGVDPSRLSFKGTLHHFSILSPYLGVASAEQQRILFENLLDRIAQEIVPYRPDRFEPRVVKRRPKPYPLMTRPRAELKARLAA